MVALAALPQAAAGARPCAGFPSRDATSRTHSVALPIGSQKGEAMQQPITPHDFATFERIALTRRQRPLDLALRPRVAPPRSRKARRIGLVLRVACQRVANRGRADHTDLGRGRSADA